MEDATTIQAHCEATHWRNIVMEDTPASTESFSLNTGNYSERIENHQLDSCFQLARIPSHRESITLRSSSLNPLRQIVFQLQTFRMLMQIPCSSSWRKLRSTTFPNPTPFELFQQSNFVFAVK